jgi:hypothetical protein
MRKGRENAPHDRNEKNVVIPTPIEPIHFDEPRAVQVRDPADSTSYHSAVHGGINVYVDTMMEAQGIIAAWPVIMQAAADKANEVLISLRQPVESNG